MRVIFLGHACHLVESDGRRILTDPWLTDGAFGGLVEHDPPLAFSIDDVGPIDAICLSHGHLDHFNAPTLAAVSDKDVPVVHPPVAHTELDDNLRRLGFTNLHARSDWEPFELGAVSIVPTPSRGVLDECAFFFRGSDGAFWNGVDAPQPPDLVGEIRERLGVADLVAVSHNSFNQPALFGLAPMKDGDHGPAGAAQSAILLGARAALPAASNLRWCGVRGAAITDKVIRRGAESFLEHLAAAQPGIDGLALAPGDGWSREGGVERGLVCGGPPERVAHDYVHRFLDTGERWCADARPTTHEIFAQALPRRTAAAPEASRYVGVPVLFEVEGEDRATFTIDFSQPGSPSVAGDHGAACGLSIEDDDLKDLFERRSSWQILMMSDRLRVTRLRHGAPPDGLHFVYAMQALFP